VGAYDQASRYITKARPSAFFSWRAPALGHRWAFRGWLDTRGIAFPGEPDRTCDTVAEFVHRNDPEHRVVVDVEFEAEPDADMLERMGEYAFRLRRERRYGPGQAGKYAVLSLLVNLTGAEQTRELNMVAEGWDDASLRLLVSQATLSREDATQALARIAAGELERWVLPWLPLLHGAAEPGNLAEWLRLAAQEPDSRSRSDFGALALVFADLAGTGPTWRAALQGWNMRQSQQVLEWQEEARKETRIEQSREYLLQALELRFGAPVPTELAAAINACEDIQELKRWFVASQTSPSLDAFRAAVGQ
jgi:hypothetical protein